MIPAIDELKTLLRAIAVARGIWLGTAERKAEEILKIHNRVSLQFAMNEAMLTPEVLIEFDKLQNLYGILGSEAQRFLKEMD